MDCRNAVSFSPIVPRLSPEETANSLTHGFGLALSLVASAVLIRACELRGEAWITISCALYACTLVAVYTASTLSHAVISPRWRRRLRSLDQGFIYLLIVGSFTPFALKYLYGVEWSILLGVMWGVALAGCLSKVLRWHRVDGISTVTYLLLGWMPVTAVKPLFENVPAAALVWVFAGGLCYTIGTWFLMHDHHKPWYHAVWHTLVIAGTACHYAVILNYVVLAA